jgi:hypothetical protein
MEVIAFILLSIKILENISLMGSVCVKKYFKLKFIFGRSSGILISIG